MEHPRWVVALPDGDGLMPPIDPDLHILHEEKMAANYHACARCDARLYVQNIDDMYSQFIDTELGYNIS